MKLSLRLIGLLGFLIFTSAFMATFLSPIYFERAGKTFIRAQVETEVRTAIDDLQSGSLEKAAGLLSKQYQDEIKKLQEELKEGLTAKVVAAIDQMQDISCECRKALKKAVTDPYKLRIVQLEQAKAQLSAFIQGKYIEVVKQLLLDLRVFFGTNAVVFMILLAVSALKAEAVAQLFLPASLLLISTLTSGYFYLFEQNWFFTIIYNDYVGYGFTAYVVVVFLFLCDIVLNRARVTTRLLNNLLSSIGSDVSLLPC